MTDFPQGEKVHEFLSCLDPQSCKSALCVLSCVFYKSGCSVKVALALGEPIPSTLQATDVIDFFLNEEADIELTEVPSGRNVQGVLFWIFHCELQAEELRRELERSAGGIFNGKYFINGHAIAVEIGNLSAVKIRFQIREQQSMDETLKQKCKAFIVDKIALKYGLTLCGESPNGRADTCWFCDFENAAVGISIASADELIQSICPRKSHPATGVNDDFTVGAEIKVKGVKFRVFSVESEANAIKAPDTKLNEVNQVNIFSSLHIRSVNSVDQLIELAITRLKLDSACASLPECTEKFAVQLQLHFLLVQGAQTPSMTSEEFQIAIESLKAHVDTEGRRWLVEKLQVIEGHLPLDNIRSLTSVSKHLLDILEHICGTGAVEELSSSEAGMTEGGIYSIGSIELFRSDTIDVLVQKYNQILGDLCGQLTNHFLLLLYHCEMMLRTCSPFSSDDVASLWSQLKECLMEDSISKEFLQQLETGIGSGKDELDDVVRSLSELLRSIRPVDLSLLLESIQRVDASAQIIAGQDVVLLLGPTGAGKSTTIHHLCGSTLEKTVVRGLDHIGPTKVPTVELESFKTSPFPRSETRSINAAPLSWSVERRGVDGVGGNDRDQDVSVGADQLGDKEELVWVVDTPGFEDTEGVEMDLVNGLAISRAVQKCRSARVLVLMIGNVADRLVGIVNLFRILCRFMPSVDEHLPSVMFAFTRTAKDQASNIGSSVDLKDKNLSVEDAQNTAFVKLFRHFAKSTGRKGETAIILDPINDDRNALIALLSALAPIQDPADAFSDFASKQSMDALNMQLRNTAQEVTATLDRIQVSNDVLGNIHLLKYRMDQLESIGQVFRVQVSLRSELQACRDRIAKIVGQWVEEFFAALRSDLLASALVTLFNIWIVEEVILARDSEEPLMAVSAAVSAAGSRECPTGEYSSDSALKYASCKLEIENIVLSLHDISEAFGEGGDILVCPYLSSNAVECLVVMKEALTNIDKQAKQRQALNLKSVRETMGRIRQFVAGLETQLVHAQRSVLSKLGDEFLRLVGCVGLGADLAALAEPSVLFPQDMNDLGKEHGSNEDCSLTHTHGAEQTGTSPSGDEEALDMPVICTVSDIEQCGDVSTKSLIKGFVYASNVEAQAMIDDVVLHFDMQLQDNEIRNEPSDGEVVTQWKGDDPYGVGSEAYRKSAPTAVWTLPTHLTLGQLQCVVHAPRCLSLLVAMKAVEATLNRLGCAAHLTASSTSFDAATTAAAEGNMSTENKERMFLGFLTFISASVVQLLSATNCFSEAEAAVVASVATTLSELQASEDVLQFETVGTFLASAIEAIIAHVAVFFDSIKMRVHVHLQRLLSPSTDEVAAAALFQAVGDSMAVITVLQQDVKIAATLHTVTADLQLQVEVTVNSFAHHALDLIPSWDPLIVTFLIRLKAAKCVGALNMSNASTVENVLSSLRSAVHEVMTRMREIVTKDPAPPEFTEAMTTCGAIYNFGQMLAQYQSQFDVAALLETFEEMKEIWVANLCGRLESMRAVFDIQKLHNCVRMNRDIELALDKVKGACILLGLLTTVGFTIEGRYIMLMGEVRSSCLDYMQILFNLDYENAVKLTKLVLPTDAKSRQERHAVTLQIEKTLQRSTVFLGIWKNEFAASEYEICQSVFSTLPLTLLQRYRDEQMIPVLEDLKSRDLTTVKVDELSWMRAVAIAFSRIENMPNFPTSQLGPQDADIPLAHAVTFADIEAEVGRHLSAANSEFENSIYTATADRNFPELSALFRSRPMDAFYPATVIRSSRDEADGETVDLRYDDGEEALHCPVNSHGSSTVKKTSEHGRVSARKHLRLMADVTDSMVSLFDDVQQAASAPHDRLELDLYMTLIGNMCDLLSAQVIYEWLPGLVSEALGKKLNVTLSTFTRRLKNWLEYAESLSERKEFAESMAVIDCIEVIMREISNSMKSLFLIWLPTKRIVDHICGDVKTTMAAVKASIRGKCVNVCRMLETSIQLAVDKIGPSVFAEVRDHSLDSLLHCRRLFEEVQPHSGGLISLIARLADKGKESSFTPEKFNAMISDGMNVCAEKLFACASLSIVDAEIIFAHWEAIIASLPDDWAEAHRQSHMPAFKCLIETLRDESSVLQRSLLHAQFTDLPDVVVKLTSRFTLGNHLYQDYETKVASLMQQFLDSMKRLLDVKSFAEIFNESVRIVPAFEDYKAFVSHYSDRKNYPGTYVHANAALTIGWDEFVRHVSNTFQLALYQLQASSDLLTVLPHCHNIMDGIVSFLGLELSDDKRCFQAFATATNRSQPNLALLCQQVMLKIPLEFSSAAKLACDFLSDSHDDDKVRQFSDAQLEDRIKGLKKTLTVMKDADEVFQKASHFAGHQLCSDECGRAMAQAESYASVRDTVVAAVHRWRHFCTDQMFDRPEVRTTNSIDKIDFLKTLHHRFLLLTFVKKHLVDITKEADLIIPDIARTLRSDLDFIKDMAVSHLSNFPGLLPGQDMEYQSFHSAYEFLLLFPEHFPYPELRQATARHIGSLKLQFSSCLTRLSGMVEQQFRTRRKEAFDSSKADGVAEGLVELFAMKAAIPCFSEEIRVKASSIVVVTDESSDRIDAISIALLNMRSLPSGREGVPKRIIAEMDAFKGYALSIRNEVTKRVSVDTILDTMAITRTLRHSAVGGGSGGGGGGGVGLSMKDLVRLGPIVAGSLKSQFEFIDAAWWDIVSTGLGDTDRACARVVSATKQVVRDGSMALSEKIAVLMANLFAHWSLSNSSSFMDARAAKSSTAVSSAATREDRNNNYLLQPHAAQIISVLSLFQGAQLRTDGTGIFCVNQMIQIGTGEGKSVTLAVASCLFALFGMDVDCACFSEILSERDESSFSKLFQAFGLDKQIKYGTFGKLCEEAMNAEFGKSEGGLRTVVQSIVAGQNKTTTEEGTAAFTRFWQQASALASSATGFLLGTSSTPVKGSAAAKRKRRSVLLIDEVDVFFNKDFYGKPYICLTRLAHPTISELLKFIWANRGDQAALRFVQLKESPSFRACCDKFSVWVPFLEESLKSMIAGVRMFEKNHDYVLDKRLGLIGYAEHDKISYKRNFGYKTTFAYFAEFEKHSITEEMLEKQLCLHVNCGTFSYAEIPKRYDVLMGVSGTIDCISDTEAKILVEDYHFQKFSFMPSVYPASRLQFSGDTVDGVKLTTAEDFYMRIAQEIKDKRVPVRGNTTRPILVFFESMGVLKKFKATPDVVAKFREMGLDINSVNVMAEGISAADEDSKVQQAVKGGSVSLMPRVFGRGTDFMVYDESVDTSGGLHVIQTFVSDELSEEKQMKGRTARQGNNGSFSMVLNIVSLEKYGIREDMVPAMQTSGQLYSTIDKYRRSWFEHQYINIQAYVQELKTQYHDSSVQFIDALLRGDAKRTRTFVIDQNKSAEPDSATSRTICLLDATGSMSALLEKTKRTISVMFERANKLLTDNGKSDAFQIQIVAYRNYDCDAADICEFSEWSSNHSSLQSFLQSVKVKGGWGNEAIEIALQHAYLEIDAYADTDQPVTQVILIGDAAPNTEEEVDFKRQERGEAYWAGTKYAAKTHYETELDKIKSKRVPVRAFFIKSEGSSAAAKAKTKATKTAFDHISRTSTAACGVAEEGTVELKVHSTEGAEQLTNLVTIQILKDICRGGDGSTSLVDSYIAKYGGYT